MIPRIEDKLEVARIDYPRVVSWLRSNSLLVLHPKRIVNSIYFDNHQMQMRFDAEEGITPRRKVRARYYGHDSLNSIETISIETKETSASGRSKSIQQNINLENALSTGIFDRMYGLCRPVVKISYVREYFHFRDWRMTLDRDITYEKFNNSLHSSKSVDQCFVLEIKTSADQDRDLLRNFFDFPRSKFSKYQRACEHLDL